MLKIMGLEFSTKEAAVHWLEVGIRLARNKSSKEKLIKELNKLKGKSK